MELIGVMNRSPAWVFFRVDRRLYGEVSRLTHRLIHNFYTAAAGGKIRSAAVIAYASAGDFVRFNPHLHGLFLGGGFDPTRTANLSRARVRTIVASGTPALPGSTRRAR